MGWQYQNVSFVMRSITLSVGGLDILLSADREVTIDNGFSPFLSACGKTDIKIIFCQDENQDEYTTVISEDGSKVIHYYNSRISSRYKRLRGCLIDLPMEQILFQHNRFFLHSAFITSPWGGLLFTGNSGVGKSTQAELWRKYRSSTVINGDRAIIANDVEGWRAYGSPYAGSSGYYVQRDEPVGAIILLEQGPENLVSPVVSSEAFRKLFLQVSLDRSRIEQVDKLCSLLTALIEAVPVYRLCCTPDIRAVEALEYALGKERLNVSE